MPQASPPSAQAKSTVGELAGLLKQAEADFLYKTKVLKPLKTAEAIAKEQV